MDVPLLDRRSAMTRLLRLSAGFVVAGIGCGVRSTAPDSTARAATPAAPTPTPTAAPTPPAQPDARAAAATPPELRLNLLAHTLEIPALQLRTVVRPAESTRNALGRPEIVVPDHGLVTANAMLGRNAINNIWILGHSRWMGVPQLLFRLPELRVGDDILVAGQERTTNTDVPLLTFRTQRLVLTDIDSAPKELYGARPRIPRVVLQTSARQAGDAAWILDRRAIEAKAERRLDGDIDDPRKYLLLLVIGELLPEHVADLAAGNS